MKKFGASLVLGVIAMSLMPLAASAQTSPKPTCAFFVSGAALRVGDTVNLTWRSTNATGGTITTIGSVGPNGTQGVIPVAPASTYRGTFTGPGGTAVCSVTVPAGGTNGGNVGGSVTSGTPGIDASNNTDGTLNIDAHIDVPTQNAPAPAPLSAPAASPLDISNPSGGSSNISNGLVTCNSAQTCNICTLSSTFQKLLDFLVGFSIPLAAAAFAFAGWLYFSNRDNPTQVERAHKIFTRVLIGFVVVLMAWLMIQTILKALAPGYVSWDSFKCSDNRLLTGDFGQVLNAALGRPQAAPVAVVPPQQPATFNSRFDAAYTCPAGWDLSGTQCFNEVDGAQMDASYSGAGSSAGSGATISNPEMAAQLATACSKYGLDSAACLGASGIALAESSGGTNCRTSPTGAAGCMQVLARTACTLDGSISDSCGSCLQSGNSTSPQCAPVIQTISNNPQLGTNLGVAYFAQQYNTFGSCQLAAAAYFQGPGAVQKYGGVPPVAFNYVNKVCK